MLLIPQSTGVSLCNPPWAWMAHFFCKADLLIELCNMALTRVALCVAFFRSCFVLPFLCARRLNEMFQLALCSMETCSTSPSVQTLCSFSACQTVCLFRTHRKFTSSYLRLCIWIWQISAGRATHNISWSVFFPRGCLSQDTRHCFCSLAALFSCFPSCFF